MIGKLWIALGCLLAAIVLVESRAQETSQAQQETSQADQETRPALRETGNCLILIATRFVDSLEEGMSCQEVHELSIEAHDHYSESCSGPGIDSTEIERFVMISTDERRSIVINCRRSNEVNEGQEEVEEDDDAEPATTA